LGTFGWDNEDHGLKKRPFFQDHGLESRVLGLGFEKKVIFSQDHGLKSRGLGLCIGLGLGAPPRGENHAVAPTALIYRQS